MSRETSPGPQKREHAAFKPLSFIITDVLRSAQEPHLNLVRENGTGTGHQFPKLLWPRPDTQIHSNAGYHTPVTLSAKATQTILGYQFPIAEIYQKRIKPVS